MRDLQQRAFVSKTHAIGDTGAGAIEEFQQDGCTVMQMTGYMQLTASSRADPLDELIVTNIHGRRPAIENRFLRSGWVMITEKR